MPVDVGHPAGAGEDGIDRDRALVVVADEIDELLPVFHAHLDGRGVEPHLDAIARERIGQDLRGVAFFLGQEQRLLLRDDGLRSEAAERLRQLAAERAAADDQQAARQLGQVEDVLVGQIAGLDEARESTGVSGRAPVAIIAFLKRSRRAVHRQRIGSGEARLAEEHIHAGRASAAATESARLMRARIAPHALHHRRKVDADVGRDLRAVAARRRASRRTGATCG